MRRRKPGEAARNEQIRNLFDDEGGDIPVRKLATRAIEEGIFSKAEVAAWGLRQVMVECRRALSETDPITNLPHAQPIEEEAEDDEDDEEAEDEEEEAEEEEVVRGPRWRQLPLFNEGQAGGLLTRRGKYLGDDHARYASLWRYFDARYPGRMPTFLDLTERHS